jgi:hypothetical protein
MPFLEASRVQNGEKVVPGPLDLRLEPLLYTAVGPDTDLARYDEPLGRSLVQHSLGIPGCRLGYVVRVDEFHRVVPPVVVSIRKPPARCRKPHCASFDRSAAMA